MLLADGKPGSLLNSSIKQDTNGIKSDVAIIKQDTTQIAAIKEDTSQIAAMHLELVALRKQVDAMNPRDGKRLVLERFLDESSAYAESVPEEPDFFELSSEVGLDTGDGPQRSNPFGSLEDDSETTLAQHGLNSRSSRPQSPESIRSIVQLPQSGHPNTSDESFLTSSTPKDNQEERYAPRPKSSV